METPKITVENIQKEIKRNLNIFLQKIKPQNVYDAKNGEQNV